MTFFRAIGSASQRMVAVIFRYRRMLAAITRIELAKRHAGSVLGFSWVVLQPALLLSVYVFVYMVVLRMRFEGFSLF
jgi:lipopolysaccharide transport system permease protein